MKCNKTGIIKKSVGFLFSARNDYIWDRDLKEAAIVYDLTGAIAVRRNLLALNYPRVWR